LSAFGILLGCVAE